LTTVKVVNFLTLSIESNILIASDLRIFVRMRACRYLISYDSCMASFLNPICYYKYRLLDADPNRSISWCQYRQKGRARRTPLNSTGIRGSTLFSLHAERSQNIPHLFQPLMSKMPPISPAFIRSQLWDDCNIGEPGAIVTENKDTQDCI
jgi:hypothetical protein